MSPDEEASSQLDKNNLQTQKRTAESTSEKERIKEADKDNDDDGGVIGPLSSEAVDKEREPVPKKKKKILHLEKVCLPIICIIKRSQQSIVKSIDIFIKS